LLSEEGMRVSGNCVAISPCSVHQTFDVLMLIVYIRGV